jgi:hypothetical protein
MMNTATKFIPSQPSPQLESMQSAPVVSQTQHNFATGEIVTMKATMSACKIQAIQRLGNHQKCSTILASQIVLYLHHHAMSSCMDILRRSQRNILQPRRTRLIGEIHPWSICLGNHHIPWVLLIINHQLQGLVDIHLSSAIQALLKH